MGYLGSCCSYAVFKWNCLKDFAFCRTAFLVPDSDRGNEFFGDNLAAGHLHLHVVRDGAESHAVNGDIETFDAAFGFAFKVVLDVCESRGHLVDIHDATFADEVGGIDGRVGFYGDASVVFLASHDACQS